MKTETAEINIHLRAREQDREVIDRAAALAGLNRSHFMLASALKEARNIILDRVHVQVERDKFNKILDWMDREASASETSGMKRLVNRKPDWRRG
jgi:uncharacterized protein (DUF1778 family)